MFQGLFMGQTKLSGSYDSLNLCGEVRGSGHLEVKNGLNVQGDLVTDSLVAKEFTLQGRLRANDVEVGSAKWNGEQRFGKGKFGTLRAEGEIQAANVEAGDEITCHGMIKIDEMSAPQISCHGRIQSKKISATVRAAIRLDGNGTSEIVELSAPEVIVDSERPRSKLHSQKIQGQSISLKDVHADLVEGDVVRIGRGCVVQKVLYRQSLDVDDDAKVASSSKI